MTNRTALVLIDLQNDFLAMPRMEPHPSTIIAGAAQLLREFRVRGLPVIHVRTKTAAVGFGRMPHWEQRDTVACVAGTSGYDAPPALRPLAGEAVFDKTWFSAFSVSAFEDYLREKEIGVLVLGGVFIQSCLRQTAIDGYQKGFRVYLAAEASGSHDPLHAALTLNYLDDRAMIPLDSRALIAVVDTAEQRREPEPPQQLDRLVISLRSIQGQWALEPMESRVAKLHQLAVHLEQAKESLAQLIVAEVKKPIVFARGEVDRAVSLLRAVAVRIAKLPQIKAESEGRIHFHPRGIVAIVTPWNNPLAIPMGKLAPALAHGNAVLWKPSPHASKVARMLVPLMAKAGFPDGLVTIVEGDERQARKLIAAEIDALAFSGSSRTGWSIIAQASARLLPVQAELGGNNGAIVAASADIKAAAAAIAEGAFGFAGQRCTSNRRAIVLAEVYEAFLAQLQSSTGLLNCGDPLDIGTRVTPMISPQAAQTIAALVERAREAGYAILQPHLQLTNFSFEAEAFHAPTIVLCDDPAAFIVQEESFGPILVVQKARDFEHALELLNQVSHGLVAALFSQNEAEQERFLEKAQAGIVKLNASTVNAGVDLPFTGWKHSGYGAGEHGEANAEFFSKRQAVYA
jgi:acyl-CoA reductase-like NAD-dependent aldehyde dehydrogenase/nicotinamidase-related amidase